MESKHLTVAELIEELKNCIQDAEVIIQGGTSLPESINKDSLHIIGDKDGKVSIVISNSF